MRSLKAEETGLKARIATAKKMHEPIEKPTIDSQIYKYNVALDPKKAWNAFGGNAESMFRTLHKESLGNLEALHRESAALAKVMPSQSKLDRLELARTIAENMDRVHNPNRSPAERQALHNHLLGVEAQVRTAQPLKAAPATTKAPADHPDLARFQSHVAATKTSFAQLLKDRPDLAAKHAALEKAAAGKAAATKATGTTPKTSKSMQQLDASYASLKPIARVPGLAFDVTKPVDAVMLRTLYGDHQLHAALSRYPLGRLQEAARAHSTDIPLRASKARQIQELITWAKTQPLLPHTPLNNP